MASVMNQEVPGEAITYSQSDPLHRVVVVVGERVPLPSQLNVIMKFDTIWVMQ